MVIFMARWLVVGRGECGRGLNGGVARATRAAGGRGRQRVDEQRRDERETGTLCAGYRVDRLDAQDHCFDVDHARRLCSGPQAWANSSLVESLDKDTVTALKRGGDGELVVTAVPA